MRWRGPVDTCRQAFSDTTKDKGGGESGFRAHDFLEAALASCINMTLRMYADQHKIPLSGVKTRVTFDRTKPRETIFTYSVELTGPLNDRQRQFLVEVAGKCPVHQTLCKKIGFRDPL